MTTIAERNSRVELVAAYERIEELEVALKIARQQLITLGGDEQTEDQIQAAVLSAINEVLQ